MMKSLHTHTTRDWGTVEEVSHEAFHENSQWWRRCDIMWESVPHSWNDERKSL